jgi:hypothetical protein
MALSSRPFSDSFLSFPKSAPRLLASLAYVLLECHVPNRAYTVGWVPLASRIIMGMDGLAFFMEG